MLFFISSQMLTYGQTPFYQYDFGSEKAEGYTSIDATQSPANFRWIKPPTGDFQMERYQGWRFPHWQDGVVAPNLQWESTLPNGTYEVQLFLNAGMEMTSTWRIGLQKDTLQPANLHPVRNGPESPRVMNAHVKIWRGQVAVKDQRLSIYLTGGQDSIRLLACHILPVLTKSQSLTNQQQWLLGMLSEYGTFSHKPVSLLPLLDNLKSTLEKDPSDAWTFKYYREATWLHLAETFKTARGWQWSKSRYQMSMIQLFQQGQMLLEPIIQQPDHPLYERALWLRGRFCFHLGREYRHVPDKQQAAKDFAQLLNQYPQDTLLRMYAGEHFYQQSSLPKIAGHAPDWSQQQAIALHHLRRLVHYWVQKRQAPNGEMGGKYGDDVEALRFWYPLFYLGDSLAITGLKRLANGVWNSDVLQDGFSKHIADVEHSSEFISDTAPVMIAVSDDKKIHERALPTARYFDQLWSEKDPDGDVFFKSSWYSSTEVDERPPRNRDVPMNSRTMKVLRYYLWRYPESTAIKNTLYDWSKGWVKLAKSTAKGKPKGVLPASYRPSDGAINGDEPNWFEANMYWPYYDFGGDVLLLDQLFFISQYVEDQDLHYPIEAAIQLVNQYRAQDGEPGSPAWTAAQFIKRNSFHALAGQWRLLTNDPRYDDLFAQYGSPYLQYRLNGTTKGLEKALATFNENMSYNWEMMTEETWFTDRIYASSPNFEGRVNADLLKTMLTGDLNASGTSPYMAVTWEGTSSGFTALVEEATKQSLQVALFDHQPQTTPTTIRLWNLQKGKYQLTLNDEVQQVFELKAAGQRLAFLLPQAELVTLRVELLSPIKK
ncbi:MAG: hypothetical protein AAF960_15410 [Bacteroidota bacterium]